MYKQEYVLVWTINQITTVKLSKLNVADDLNSFQLRAGTFVKLKQQTCQIKDT